MSHTGGQLTDHVREMKLLMAIHMGGGCRGRGESGGGRCGGIARAGRAGVGQGGFARPETRGRRGGGGGDVCVKFHFNCLDFSQFNTFYCIDILTFCVGGKTNSNTVTNYGMKVSLSSI